ncbi:hypothetical protein E2986_03085 [Frieseomelitta varia]|uniref:Histidine decarboxylase n=1 Tax=Frieseomelitta varia TaxID=561572 RepID=A0A833S3J1_9HYME|nr:hypothetical protein E2986_03085 [Frieseomelitta varia]
MRNVIFASREREKKSCIRKTYNLVGRLDRDFKLSGKEMVDYIADYLANIRSRRVYPAVSPGYLRNVLPVSAPLDGEPWEDIFADIERCIMPGVTHWQSPHMHAYFPALNSPASLLADMLADAINCLGFTWASSPACTELETIVMNWLGKMIGLPEEFLHRPGGSGGGGVIQTTASEATLVCLLAARTRAIRDVQQNEPDRLPAEINSRLVAYCSDQVCATLGTTGACAFDNLKEVGQVCEQNGLWLHVDAAYAGSAFVCPEFRGWLQGIEYADSIAFNPSKWLMVHFDCTAMWVKSSQALHRTFNVDPLYLKHENSGNDASRLIQPTEFGLAIDYMGVRLAQKFEALVLADARFEIPATRHLGLVVFRLRGENSLTERLLKKMNSRGRVHCVPAALHGKYVIRFTVTSTNTTNEDILRDWAEIRNTANEILGDTTTSPVRAKVPLAGNAETNGKLTTSNSIRPISLFNLILKSFVQSNCIIYFQFSDTREKNENFGSSLLLANSPMSPKIVNGSFAAIYDTADIFEECTKAFGQLRLEARDSPAMRRRIRGILMSGKQFSLDSRMDLVQGYACCRPAIEMASELPLQEDEDLGTNEISANQSKNDNSGECATAQEEAENSEKTNQPLRRQTSKSRSNYAMNGSVKVGSQDCSETLTSMMSTEGNNMPRSETIAAIGHRPCTGDLSSIQSQNESPNKETEGSLEDAQIVCRKCGHCMKKE